MTTSVKIVKISVKLCKVAVAELGKFLFSEY